MGKKSSINYDNLTIDEVLSLNEYHRQKYETYKTAKKQRNKAKTDFLRSFEESCKKYK